MKDRRRSPSVNADRDCRELNAAAPLSLLHGDAEVVLEVDTQDAGDLVQETDGAEGPDESVQVVHIVALQR